MLTQVFPAVQSAAVVVQVVLHASRRTGTACTSWSSPPGSAPMPSHDRGDDSVDPVQLAAPHVVPAA